MKTISTIVLSFIVLLMLAFAPVSKGSGVFILAGSGVDIPATSQVNFPQLAPVGTFTLYQRTIEVTNNGVASAGGLELNGRLTFDGTNFFIIPQTYTNLQTVATNDTWTVTATTFTVYGELTATNKTASVITNFQAQLQN